MKCGYADFDAGNENRKSFFKCLPGAGVLLTAA